MATTTRVRVLNANLRLEPHPDDIAAGRGWDARRDRMAAAFDLSLFAR